MDADTGPFDEKKDAPADTLLREEFVQAWAHFRHLEVTRTQYLALFLATTTAAVGVGSQIAARSNFADLPTILAFGVSLMTYVLFVSIVYATMTKIQFVLSHYARQMRAIRDCFYGGIDRALPPYNTLDIRDSNDRSIPSQMIWRLTSIHSSAEIAVLTAAGIAGAVQLLLVVSAVMIRPHNWWTVGAEISMSLVTWMAIAVMVWMRTTSPRHAADHRVSRQ